MPTSVKGRHAGLPHRHQDKAILVSWQYRKT